MKRTLAALALGLVTLGSLKANAILPMGGKASAWGTKDYFSFVGEVKIAPDGTTAGYFNIVIDTGSGKFSACRFEKFRNGRVYHNLATFDAYGACMTDTGAWFSASNRIALTDNGEPGAGLDVIDVNYYGPTGVAIPGGPIASGNIDVSP